MRGGQKNWVQKFRDKWNFKHFFRAWLMKKSRKIHADLWVYKKSKKSKTRLKSTLVFEIFENPIIKEILYKNEVPGEKNFFKKKLLLWNFFNVLTY